MVHLAIIPSEAGGTVVTHAAQQDNSCRLVSAFMSQQESATCEDALHFNFLSSFSLTLSVHPVASPPRVLLVVKSACLQSLITAGGSPTDGYSPAGEVCQSRLHPHFLQSSNPSLLPEKEILRQKPVRHKKPNTPNLIDRVCTAGLCDTDTNMCVTTPIFI